MTKSKTEKTEYVCESCGAISPRWSGQCTDCGEWNCFTAMTKRKSPSSVVLRAGYAGQAGGNVSQPLKLDQIALSETPRVSTQQPELDRVLGGGLVKGSVILMGGDPGIGKSTLLLQTLAALGEALPVLYVTGEESLEQIALRAQRLGIKAPHLDLLSETEVFETLRIAEALKPAIMVIDSIQTFYLHTLNSAPGSVSQIRETAGLLTQWAKKTGTTIFLIGHVTKDGQLAGPRVLEHMVDTVIYFENQQDSRFRLVRAIKNRFGTVNELGLFAMTDKGLKGISHPSAIFLSQTQEEASGSAITVLWEGTRPLLIEVQALVDPSHLGNPRRVSLGVDPQRLVMNLAILHRHGGIPTFDQDVFINVVGGVKITETSADLAVIAAVTSSLRHKVLPKTCICFGELGLSGEIRPVPYGPERLKEAQKHGFEQAILHPSNCPKKGKGSDSDMTLLTAKNLNELLVHLENISQPLRPTKSKSHEAA